MSCEVAEKFGDKTPHSFRRTRPRAMCSETGRPCVENRSDKRSAFSFSWFPAWLGFLSVCLLFDNSPLL